MKQELSLLVDGDQVPPGAVAAILERLGAEWLVTSRVCVRNWRSTKDVADWKRAASEMALQCLQRDPVATGKNAADVELAVIAMDQFHGLGYRAFCIISADTDFTPLVDRLRRAACHVEWVKDAAKRGSGQSGKAAPAGGRQPRAAQKTSTVAADASTKTPAPKPAPGRGAKAAKPAAKPAAKQTRAAAAAAGADAPKQARRAVTALREKGKHDRGWVTVQAVGQWLSENRVDRATLGSKSAPLWRNLKSLTGLKVEEREDGRYWVSLE